MKRFLTTLAALLVCQVEARSEVKTEIVTYKYGDQTFKGYLAFDNAAKGKRPGILVVHEWWGLNDYARKRTEQLAKMGYVAFAADMYGDGKTTEHPKEAGAMAGMVRKNQKEWLGRANAGLDVLRKHAKVDSGKLAAIGYCFGGSTALQLAHSNSGINAAVSFHGALLVPDATNDKAITAKILICHGAADSFIPEETCQKVRTAYEQLGVDYQMIYYGGAQHSFTVKGADDRGLKGIRYNAAADRHSWAAMTALFDDVFGKK
ncbi:MAG: dienelactone hydrolase family protein [Gemmataceae bacterium]|nr:dienelactone hydrolase family protein [Gemmataceae bacterium]